MENTKLDYFKSIPKRLKKIEQKYIIEYLAPPYWVDLRFQELLKKSANINKGVNS